MTLGRKDRQSSAPRFCAEAMEPRVMLAATLVKDLNLVAQRSSIHTLGHVGNIAIFAENDGVHGVEPYRSDGTEAGTFLLRDIIPGKESATTSFVAANGNTMYFSALFGKSGTLWRTDGTVAGTVKLANVFPSPAHAFAGNTLFFIGNERFSDGSARNALWKTDGTSAGTVRLSDDIGGINQSVGGAQQMGAINGSVFFAANDQAHGTELWRSDGTPAGTKLFADLVAGTTSSKPTKFTATTDRLYFVDNIFNSKKQHLWKTDGTSLKLVETSGNRSDPSNPALDDLTAMGDRLYFLEDENESIFGLDSVWRTTGKADTLLRVGTILNPSILPMDPNGPAVDRLYVKEDRPTVPTATFYSLKGDSLTAVGPNSSASINWASQIGNDVYYATRAADNSASDAFRANTEDGTVLLKHFPGEPTATDFVAAGSKVYFVTSSVDPLRPLITSVLWITDGTKTVKDVTLQTTVNLFLVPEAVATDSRLYFAPDSPYSELWISDGSPGTHQISDIDPNTAESRPQLFTAGVGGTYFGASNGIYLYSESTRNVTLLAPFTADFVQFVGKLGTAEIIVTGHAVWRSDGTAAGTKQIFVASGFLGSAAIAANALYFDDGRNIFKSDGTASGTKKLVGNLHLGAPAVALNKQVIFSGIDNKLNFAVWSTDGTTAGTMKIADLTTLNLFTFGGAVYFFANGKTGTQDLWRTDGTAKGTKLIKAGFGGGNEVAVAGDSFYFYNSVQLWNSDGTASGTKLLKQFTSAVTNVFLTAVGKRVYFPAFDPSHGFELWTSLGGKTVLLKDINPGRSDSLEIVGNDEDETLFPVDTAAAPNGKLYFAADDGKHGFELWETDATPSGTKLVQDIRSGAASSTPMHLAVTGNTLLFSADDGVHGREPWQLPLA